MSSFIGFARCLFHPRMLIAGFFTVVGAMGIARFRYRLDSGSLLDQIRSGDNNALIGFWWLAILLSFFASGAFQGLYDRISTERSLLIPNFRERLAGFSLGLIALLGAISLFLAAPALDSFALAAALVSVCALVFASTLMIQIRSVAAVITLFLIAPATLLMPEWSLWLARASPPAITLACLALVVIIVRSAHRGEGWLESVLLLESDPSSDDLCDMEVVEHPAPIARYQQLPRLHTSGQPLSTIVKNLTIHATFYITSVLHISPRVQLNVPMILWGLLAYTAILVTSDTFWPSIHVVIEVVLLAIVPAIAIYYLPVTTDGMNLLPRRAQADVILWSSTARTLCIVAFVLVAVFAASIVNLMVSTLLPALSSDAAGRTAGLPGIATFVLQAAGAAPLLVALRMLTTTRAVAHFTEPWAPMRDFLLFLAFAWCIASWYGALDKYAGIGHLSLASALGTAIIWHGLFYALLRWRLARADLSMGRA